MVSIRLKGGGEMSWFDSVKTQNAKEAVKELLEAKGDEEKLKGWKKKYEDKKEDENIYIWRK